MCGLAGSAPDGYRPVSAPTWVTIATKITVTPSGMPAPVGGAVARSAGRLAGPVVDETVADRLGHREGPPAAGVLAYLVGLAASPSGLWPSGRWGVRDPA